MKINPVENSIAFKSGYPTFGSNGHLSKLNSGYPTHCNDVRWSLRDNDSWMDDPTVHIGVYFKPIQGGLLDTIA